MLNCTYLLIWVLRNLKNLHYNEIETNDYVSMGELGQKAELKLVQFSKPCLNDDPRQFWPEVWSEIFQFLNKFGQ